MKNLFLKTLSLLLCLAMFLSLLPASACADMSIAGDADAEPAEVFAGAPAEVPAVEVFEPPAKEPAGEALVESSGDPEGAFPEQPAEEPSGEALGESLAHTAGQPTEESEEETIGESTEASVEESVEEYSDEGMETDPSEAGLNGWYRFGDEWTYYRDNTRVKNDWVKDGGKWYYMGKYGYMVHTGPHTVGSKCYLFESSGVWIDRSGWVSLTIDGGTEWYYLQSGEVLSGWQQIDGAWYYLAPEMLTDGQTISGKKYLFNASGVWISGDGWKCLKWGYNDYWYYLKNSEYLTGWQTIGGKQYYFQDWGEMATGVVRIGSKDTVFDRNGQQVTSGWVSIPWISSEGTNHTDWFYVLSGGKPAAGLQTIGGKKYYFNEDSYVMVTGG